MRAPEPSGSAQLPGPKPSQCSESSQGGPGPGPNAGAAAAGSDTGLCHGRGGEQSPAGRVSASGGGSILDGMTDLQLKAYLDQKNAELDEYERLRSRRLVNGR